MEFTKKVYCEDVDVVVITASYTEQSEEVQDNLWTDMFFRLINTFNNSSNSGICTFTMKQGGRDENGFYPNYYYLVLEKGREEHYVSLLEGYNFKINVRDEKHLKVMLDYFDDFNGCDDAYLDIQY